MNRGKNAWLTGAIALATTLLILFGAQTVWHTFAVAKPLDKAFQGIDGVQAVTWDKGKDEGPVTLKVKFDNVVNLQTSYNAVQGQAKDVLGKTPFQIVIQDSRSPELEELYHELHYHIQEAIFTGHFGDMASKVETEAKLSGAASRVYVDAQNIYLQLTKGEADLYAVVPRANTIPGVK